MCDIMNIDIDICCENDIDIVFTANELSPEAADRFGVPICLFVGLLNWRKYLHAVLCDRNIITVANQVPQFWMREDRTTPWFVATQDADTEKPEYQVTGVWSLSSGVTSLSAVDAYVPRDFVDDMVDPDAWLI